jgi:hypothetical protein
MSVQQTKIDTNEPKPTSPSASSHTNSGIKSTGQTKSKSDSQLYNPLPPATAAASETGDAEQEQSTESHSADSVTIKAVYDYFWRECRHRVIGFILTSIILFASLMTSAHSYTLVLTLVAYVLQTVCRSIVGWNLCLKTFAKADTNIMYPYSTMMYFAFLMYLILWALFMDNLADVIQEDNSMSRAFLPFAWMMTPAIVCVLMDCMKEPGPVSSTTGFLLRAVETVGFGFLMATCAYIHLYSYE